ncbi:OX-2 membrane glycoprotein-like [Nematolebias whitei]|uniref:OX-2 membrane glycoprotein-like n=1 Tax=Nematolebias whitei TaxID=451745 RepID=UPI0018973EB4|nr:OX-2 membrane glycoprotein-like [Nematolebias whitei]
MALSKVGRLMSHKILPSSNFDGAAAVIQTETIVLAAVGGQACLTCQLTEYKEVVQFTWQKILPDGEKNLATYAKAFGQRVSPDVKKKMDFHCKKLQNCSVVIRKVTEQDEGCYRCLFNTYPQGAMIGTTCLRLYELHEPVLQARGSKSPEESLVSCSATGRPAPTVTLTAPQQHLHLSQHNTVTVTNTNNTVTVTTTAVLSGLHDDGAQVGCAARVDSGPQVEVVKRIAEFRQTTADDGEELFPRLRFTDLKSRCHV